MNRTASVIARARSAWSSPRAAAARAWLVAHPSLVLLVALALAWAGLVQECRRAGRAEAALAAAAKRAGEEGAALRDDVPVVEQLPRAEVERRAELAARGSAELQLSLARARRAVPGARVTGVATAAVEGAAHGRPRPAPQDAPPAAGGAAGPSVAGGSPATPTGGTCPACLLADGDGLRLELVNLELTGPAGARLLAGTLSAARKADGEVLLRQPFSGRRVEAAEELPPAPPANPSKGAGLRGQCVEGGCAAGLAASWQPFRWLELSGDASFFGAAAAKGAGGSVLVRW